MKVTVDSQELARLEQSEHDLRRRIAMIHAEVSPSNYDVGTAARVYKLCTQPLPTETIDISTCRDDISD